MAEPIDHNYPTEATEDFMEGPDSFGVICILSADGRLFGPFPSRSIACSWMTSQSIPAYSTYDLLNPQNLNSGE